MQWQHETICTNGIDLHVVQAGPEDGPLVILLHGFPEFWKGFEKQIPKLIGAGYRVWAPDQRGYNLSAKPEGIAPYSLDEMANDVLGLIEASGRDRVHLVGHDWGAAVAWWTGIKYPDKIEKLAILNVPHPVVMGRYVRQNLSQLKRSWYIFFFQIPRLPEFLLSRNNFAAMVSALRSSARAGTFTSEELTEYRQA